MRACVCVCVCADSHHPRLWQDKRSKLPAWIRQYTMESHVSLSTDMAVSAAKEFLAKMSKPDSIQTQVGTVLLSVDDIQGAGISYAPDKPSVTATTAPGPARVAGAGGAEPASKRLKTGNRAPHAQRPAATAGGNVGGRDEVGGSVGAGVESES